MPSACTKCGYDISGLPKEIACPECSWPIADSLFRDPRWLVEDTTLFLLHGFTSLAWLQSLGLVVTLLPLLLPFSAGGGYVFVAMLTLWGLVQATWLYLCIRLRRAGVAIAGNFLLATGIVGVSAAIACFVLFVMLALADQTWCFLTLKFTLVLCVPLCSIAQSAFINHLTDTLSKKPSGAFGLLIFGAVLASLAVAFAILILDIYTAFLLLLAAIPAFAIGAIRSFRVRRLLELHLRRVGGENGPPATT